MKVKGKVCVVTGAAGGIGEAIARRFAKEGAKGLVVADMDAGRLDKVAKAATARLTTKANFMVILRVRLQSFNAIVVTAVDRLCEHMCPNSEECVCIFWDLDWFFSR